MPALLHARPPATPEARRLRELATARHAPASWIQRARIIAAGWDGADVAEVARRLGWHPKTVYTWLHWFNTGGIDGLADLPRPGVPAFRRRVGKSRDVWLMGVGEETGTVSGMIRSPRPMTLTRPCVPPHHR